MREYCIHGYEYIVNNTVYRTYDTLGREGTLINIRVPVIVFSIAAIPTLGIPTAVLGVALFDAGGCAGVWGWVGV